MSTFDCINYVREEVANWAGVTVAPHRYGGLEMMLGARELGHLQPDGLLNIPFSQALRDQLLAESKAMPHPIYAKSGWVSFEISTHAAVYHGIWLLKLSLEYNRLRQYRQSQSLSETVRQEIQSKLKGLGLSPQLYSLLEPLWH